MKEINLKGLKETIYYDTCDNGLKVYMWVKKNVSSFYATLSVKYGSLYNEFKIGNKKYCLPKGVAHFLEHVKFNEDKDTTANDYYFKNGCDTNAFTTFNYTNYQVLGSENPTPNIIHLLDFVQKGYFNKNIVSNEKGIIVEEANMGLDDPYTVMLFKHLDNIFTNYDYKYPITGDAKSIKEITMEDIELAFNTFYHPENSFLVVTGNFNPYELMEKIRENQDKKEFPKYLKPTRVVNRENKKVNKEYEEVDINVTNKKIKIGIKIPKKSLNLDDILIRIYTNILFKANFGNTSDFKDDLLSKELITGMSFMTDLFDDYLLIILTIDSNYTKEIIDIFSHKLDNLTLDEKTFNRIKNASLASLILEYEDVETVNSIIQSEILSYGDVVDNLKEVYENIAYNDIVKYMKNIDTKERSILVLNPKEK